MHHARRFALVRWGLVPSWVEDPKRFSLLINARTEGILDKPAFSAAMQYRRCLVPASGFYEWRAPGQIETAVLGQAGAGGGVIAFAGLWETWSDRDGGEIDSACIVTTPANAAVAPIHDRMPVVIAPENFEHWLTGEAGEANALLKPAPDDLFEAIPVSDRVNKADADDPGLIEPVALMRTDLFGE